MHGINWHKGDAALWNLWRPNGCKKELVLTENDEWSYTNISSKIEFWVRQLENASGTRSGQKGA
jgi:hypothetical protein